MDDSDDGVSEHTPPDHAEDVSRLARFEQYRGLLFSVAYRMVGSVADAEDILQEAFIRWQGASEADIRSPRAFLVTIVSRLSINHLESARVRREQYPGEWLPEPIVVDQGTDTAQAMEVDESVSLALLLVLERLTPVERAVFLLREIFDYSHAEIASTVGLSEAYCRQLLRRARQHVRGARPRFRASFEEHVELLERFQHAARSGDVDRLLSYLSSEVVLHSDGGGRAPAHPKPIYGADKVARAIVHAVRKYAQPDKSVQRAVRINGLPGVVNYREGRPTTVFTLEVSGGRVQAIYVVTNPEKLAHLPPPPS
jgi:RNA polymerase sigma-70 factor, ECF subfamily